MRVVTEEAAAVEVVIAAIIEGANRNLFSEIWNRMKSPQSRRPLPYIFHAFLSPLWESIWHCWAQSLSINTCSIGWLSLETHCFLLDVHLARKDAQRAAPFMCPLVSHSSRPWRSSHRKQVSQVFRAEREVSLHLYSRSMVSCWGKIRNANPGKKILKQLSRASCASMPGAVREAHGRNPSRVPSMQQDGLLGCLRAPAVRFLISSLPRPQPDGGGSSPHPQAPSPSTEEALAVP